MVLALRCRRELRVAEDVLARLGEDRSDVGKVAGSLSVILPGTIARRTGVCSSGNVGTLPGIWEQSGNTRRLLGGL